MKLSTVFYGFEEARSFDPLAIYRELPTSTKVRLCFSSRDVLVNPSGRFISFASRFLFESFRGHSMTMMDTDTFYRRARLLAIESSFPREKYRCPTFRRGKRIIFENFRLQTNRARIPRRWRTRRSGTSSNEPSTRQGNYPAWVVPARPEGRRKEGPSRRTATRTYSPPRY